MNRSILTRGAALAIAAAAAGVSLAAAPAFAATAAASGTQVSYVLDFTNTTFAPGDAAGATIVGTGTVDDLKGNQVGTVDDVCTLISVPVNGGEDVGQCTDTLQLSDGEIQISTLGDLGSVAQGHNPTFAGIIQGGSGSYDGVAGDVDFTQTAPTVYRADLNLR